METPYDEDLQTADHDLERRLAALGGDPSGTENGSPPTESLSDLDRFAEDGELTQWTTRATRDGFETQIHYERVVVSACQTRVILHLPFHPPFPQSPDVEAIAVNADARVRITDRQKFGVRLEIVLPSPGDSDRIIILETTCSCPVA